MKNEHLYSDQNSKTQHKPISIIAILLVMIMIWFVFHYRSNSFFTHEGVSLGMTPQQVEELLPAAGKFKKVKVIDQRSGDIIKFAMLESKGQSLPWKRLFIVSMEDEVVGISTYATDITGEQIEDLKSNMLSLYGVPDDNFESKYGSKTLVWHARDRQD
ncbi:MAG: hypothetical protein JKY59_10065 [Emcibacter sp.]|nr:hypothetical protein [Emcibacter sp.]